MISKAKIEDMFDRFEDSIGRFGDNFNFRSEHNESVPTKLNTTLDPSATDGNGNMLFGHGNFAKGFEVQHNTHEGIEVAMKLHYRTGDDIAPTSIDKHGVINFDVPSGPQVADPAHNVYSANPNRAAWNFDFSVDALAGKDLSKFDVHVLLDVDPTAGVNYLDLHLVKAPAGNPSGSQSGYIWETAATHQNVIGDDGGVPNQVTQNSFNFAFIKNLIDTDPHAAGVQPYNFGPATFDIELIVNENDPHGHQAAAHDYIKSASEVSHDTVADMHFQVHVIDHALV